MSKAYHRQAAVNKYIIGWKKSEDSPPPEEPEVAGAVAIRWHEGKHFPFQKPHPSAYARENTYKKGLWLIRPAKSPLYCRWKAPVAHQATTLGEGVVR